uniref:Uncharacterized protein n=1 Tax=Anopheles albimanus TaxID=7167 RepID=A0A182FXF1_ANOAL
RCTVRFGRRGNANGSSKQPAVVKSFLEGLREGPVRVGTVVSPC